MAWVNPPSYFSADPQSTGFGYQNQSLAMKALGLYHVTCQQQQQQQGGKKPKARRLILSRSSTQSNKLSPPRVFLRLLDGVGAGESLGGSPKHSFFSSCGWQGSIVTLSLCFDQIIAENCSVPREQPNNVLEGCFTGDAIPKIPRYVVFWFLLFPFFFPIFLMPGASTH